jgi:hypothetical protein
MIVFFILAPQLLFARLPDSASTPGPDSAVYFFYKDHEVGSQAKYNPGDFFINGGFGVWQFSNNRQLFKVPYGTAFENTWYALRRPMYSIQHMGFKRWLTTEIVPSSLKVTHGNYFANYFLHTLGAGMQSRKMEEWYRYHELPYPRIWSLVTMLCEHFFEEMIENSIRSDLPEDPVTDMYIFNPAGVLLFLNNDICRFFSTKLSLNEWSLQPSINLRNGQLENMGQFYVVKLPVERTGTWSILGYFGMQELLGVTRTFSGGKSLSVTGGAIINSLGVAEISHDQKAYFANLSWSLGIFYDVKNSLLTSLILSGAEHNRLRLNIYPGLIRFGSFSPGLFIDNTGTWAFGVSVRYCPIGASVQP